MDPNEQRIITESLAEQDMNKKDRKELKPARSQAELVRTRNSNILVCIAVASWLTNTLVALKVFGIIG